MFSRTEHWGASRHCPRRQPGWSATFTSLHRSRDRPAMFRQHPSNAEAASRPRAGGSAWMRPANCRRTAPNSDPQGLAIEAALRTFFQMDPILPRQRDGRHPGWVGRVCPSAPRNHSRPPRRRAGDRRARPVKVGTKRLLAAHPKVWSVMGRSADTPLR